MLPYKIKQKKRQNCRQSVVAGRQQLYCAVQSRSPNHCQTTTGKVQSSARDGTSSATVHSWQTTASCVMHELKPLGRHGRRDWWMVPPAWLCQQSADDVECLFQMSEEDSGKPERTAGMSLAAELTTNGAHEAMGLCVLTTSLRKPNGRRSRWTAQVQQSPAIRLSTSCDGCIIFTALVVWRKSQRGCIVIPNVRPRCQVRGHARWLKKILLNLWFPVSVQ